MYFYLSFPLGIYNLVWPFENDEYMVREVESSLVKVLLHHLFSSISCSYNQPHRVLNDNSQPPQIYIHFLENDRNTVIHLKEEKFTNRSQGRYRWAITRELRTYCSNATEIPSRRILLPTDMFVLSNTLRSIYFQMCQCVDQMANEIPSYTIVFNSIFGANVNRSVSPFIRIYTCFSYV